MKTPQNYFRALTIAGSDSGGGAGIQADLKTFSAFGVYGMTAITAVTAQNTREVRSISPVSPRFVVDQIDCVLEDIGADAAKIGMLFDSEIIKAVADRLRFHRVEKITLDPVMIAKSGDKLLKEDAVESLQKDLLPFVELVTPNLAEASYLTNRSLKTVQDIEQAAKDLLKAGPKAALIKGGHFDDPEISRDCLALRSNSGEVIQWFQAPRIHTQNTHGTGCTLSAAICSLRAMGFSITESVQGAKNYLTRALLDGALRTLGHGHGPVQHLWNYRDPASELSIFPN